MKTREEKLELKLLNLAKAISRDIELDVCSATGNFVASLGSEEFLITLEDLQDERWDLITKQLEKLRDGEHAS